MEVLSLLKSINVTELNVLDTHFLVITKYFDVSVVVLFFISAALSYHKPIVYGREITSTTSDIST